MIGSVELSESLPGEGGLGAAHMSIVASDAFAFVVGSVAWVEVQVIGRLYVGELFLLACGLGLPLLYAHLRAPREQRLLAWFFALGALYLLGLVATDLYRHTSFSDYARGWARAVVYLADFAGLVVLGYRRPIRLVLFVAGTAASQIALTAFRLWPTDWKFGYAYPVTVAVLVLVDSRKPARSFMTLGILGFAHLLMDYRMFGGICALTGVLSYVKGSHSSRGIRPRAVVMAVGAATAFGFLYLSGAGLVGSASDRIERRQGSNVERLAGFVVAGEAIRESPVVGHGSWPKSDESVDTWALLQEELGSGRTAEAIGLQALMSPEGALIRAHSMILQAWVEAGLVGLVFFGFSFVVAVIMLVRLLTAGSPSRYLSLVCFYGLWALWALVMSPFAGVSRLYTATSFSLLFVFNRPTA